MKKNRFNLLRVMGIILTICGGLEFIDCMIFQARTRMTGYDASGADIGIWVIPIVYAALFALVIEIFAGLFVIDNFIMPKYANLYIILGVAIMVLTLISTVSSLAVCPEKFSFVCVFVGLILPVPYIIGAIRLKKTGSKSNM